MTILTLVNLEQTPLLGSGNVLRGTYHGVMHHISSVTGGVKEVWISSSLTVGGVELTEGGFAVLTELVEAMEEVSVGLTLFIHACPVVSSGSTKTC